MDFFNKWFTYNKNNEDIGSTGIPRDIEEDLRNRKSAPSKPRDDDSQSWSIYGSSSFEKEFQKMFQEFDNLFRRGFNERPMIEYRIDDFDKDVRDGETGEKSSKSLREKMLNGDRENNLPTPFIEQPDGFMDQFGSDTFTPHSMFRNFFNFPFHSQYPRESKQPKEDQDFDDDISSGKQSLDDILRNEETDHSRDDTFFHPFLWDSLVPDPQENTDFRGAFKYSTITRKYNPNGSVEVHTSKKDSDGNEETSVTRTLGDQTHTVINKKNIKGEEETKENFTNMHQDDLKVFDEKWKEEKPKPREKLLVPHDKNKDNSISDMFSSWWKPKL